MFQPSSVFSIAGDSYRPLIWYIGTSDGRIVTIQIPTAIGDDCEILHVISGGPDKSNSSCPNGVSVFTAPDHIIAGCQEGTITTFNTTDIETSSPKAQSAIYYPLGYKTNTKAIFGSNKSQYLAVGSSGESRVLLFDVNVDFAAPTAYHYFSVIGVIGGTAWMMYQIRKNGSLNPQQQSQETQTASKQNEKQQQQSTHEKTSKSHKKPQMQSSQKTRKHADETKKPNPPKKAQTKSITQHKSKTE